MSVSQRLRWGSWFTIFSLDAPIERSPSRIMIIMKKFLFFIYIYIYAFSRRFYPKRLTLHSSYSFYILSALAFPGNRTHDLGVASTMLYQLSYRKAIWKANRKANSKVIWFTLLSSNWKNSINIFIMSVIQGHRIRGGQGHVPTNIQRLPNCP